MHKIFYAPDGGCGGGGQVYRLTLQGHSRSLIRITDHLIEEETYGPLHQQSAPINELTKRIRENSIRIERSLHNKGRPKISNCSFRVSGLVDLEELHSMATFPETGRHSFDPEIDRWQWHYRPIEPDEVVYTAVLSTSDGNFQDDDPPPPVGDPSRVFTGILELPDAITFKGNVVETDLTIWDPIWLLKNNIVKKVYNEPPPQEGDPNFDEELEEWKLRKDKKPVQVFTYDPDRVVFDPANKDKSLLHLLHKRLLYKQMPNSLRYKFFLDDSAPAINYKAPFHEFDGGMNIAKAIGDVLQSHHHALIADKSGRIKPVDLYLSDTNEEEMPPLECDIRTERIRIKNKEIKHDGIWMSFRRTRDVGRYVVAEVARSSTEVQASRFSAPWNPSLDKEVYSPDFSSIKGADVIGISFKDFQLEAYFWTTSGSGYEERPVVVAAPWGSGSLTGTWTFSWASWRSDIVLNVASYPSYVSVSGEGTKNGSWHQRYNVKVKANVRVSYESPEFYVYTPDGETPNNPKEVKADRLYAVANKAEHTRIFNKVAATYDQLEKFATRTCTFTTQKEPTLGGLYTIELPLNEEVIREHITYKKYKKLSVRMQEIRTKVYTDRSVNEYECTCEIIKPVETLQRIHQINYEEFNKKLDKEIEQRTRDGWHKDGKVYDVFHYSTSKKSADFMMGELRSLYVRRLPKSWDLVTDRSAFGEKNILGWALIRREQGGELEKVAVYRMSYAAFDIGQQGPYFTRNYMVLSMQNEQNDSINIDVFRESEVYIEYINIAVRLPFERMTGAP